MKVKCPFMLRSVPSGRDWKVTIMCGIHNHELATDLDGHDILGSLKHGEINFVSDMTKYNMAPRYIVVALKDRDLESLMIVKHVCKARSTDKTSKRSPLTETQHLLCLIHDEKCMYWFRNISELNVVADIFWTYLDLVKLLNMFHLVFILYYTYKTNWY